MTLLPLLFYAVFFALAIAQDVSIPLQWVNTTSTLGLHDRTEISRSVLDTFEGAYQNDGTIAALALDQNAELFMSTALFDFVTSNNTHGTALRNRFLGIRAKLLPSPQPIAINEPFLWGIGAIYAYNAYQEQDFLEDAIAIWQKYNHWVVSPLDAVNERHPLKNGTFPSSCNGESNAGAVFHWIGDGQRDSLITTAGDVGSYMGLSAHLYNITNNQTYHDAARLSAEFIQSHLYDGTTNYVRSTVNLSDCQVTPPGQEIYTINSGVYLEALSVFSHKTNNETLIQRADQLALNIMKFSPWDASNGVIHEDISVDVAFRCILIRALFRHWSLSPPHSQISELVKAFLLVQYNNLLNNVRYPGTNLFSPDWNGLSSSTPSPLGQLVALSVLNPAIVLASNESESTSTASQSNPTTSTLPTNPVSTIAHRAHVGAIIGGTIGGVFFMALVIVIILILRRKRDRNPFVQDTRINELQSYVHVDHSVEPFPQALTAQNVVPATKLRATPLARPPGVLLEEPLPAISPLRLNRAQSVTGQSNYLGAPPDYQTVA